MLIQIGCLSAFLFIVGSNSMLQRGSWLLGFRPGFSVKTPAPGQKRRAGMFLIMSPKMDMSTKVGFRRYGPQGDICAEARPPERVIGGISDVVRDHLACAGWGPAAALDA